MVLMGWEGKEGWVIKGNSKYNMRSYWSSWGGRRKKDGLT